MNLPELVRYPFQAIVLFGSIPALIGLAIIGLVAWAEHSRGARSLGRLPWWLTVLLGFPLGVVVWLVWMTWSALGTTWTYADWQVVACVLTVIAVTAVLGWFTRRPLSGPMLAGWAVTAGYSTAWVVPASQDETGLFGVGYLMLVVGGGAAMLLLGAIVAMIRQPLARRGRNRRAFN